MASLTVRNIPEDAKLRFRQAAAARGLSMEEHLRQLVIEAGFGNEPEFSGVKDMTPSFRHFEPDPKAKSRARIERLIERGRGVNWEPEPRTVETLREIDLG